MRSEAVWTASGCLGDVVVPFRVPISRRCAASSRDAQATSFPGHVEHDTIGDHAEPFAVDVDLQRDLFYRRLRVWPWNSAIIRVSRYRPDDRSGRWGGATLRRSPGSDGQEESTLRTIPVAPVRASVAKNQPSAVPE